MTVELKETIMKKVKDRTDDSAISVLSRLENCADLVAEEAIYHVDCYFMFVSQDKQHEHKGRPIHKEKMAKFTKLCEWLERDGDCELHTMKELMEKVKEFAEKDEIYSEKSVRRKLKEKYNNHIFFTDIPGRESVISFKDMVSYVLLEKKKQKEESKESIIIAAAKIIKEELRELRKDNQVYPTFEELQSSECQKEWVSECLQLLLQYLILSNMKQPNIGQ